MSDHWKALADLLGTPPLDRGTVEPSQDVEPTKSSEKLVDSGNVVKASDTRESKSAFTSTPIPKTSEMDEGLSQEKSSPSASINQPKAVENQKNMEDKNSVTPAVPKRSAGWDALARLFGLSAPPPDADVPLPESPKEKEPEVRAAVAKPAPPAMQAPVSKSQQDELDLTQLGWPAPKQPKGDASRERSASQESPREPVARDRTSRDSASRDSVARDGGSRDGGSRERSGRDPGGRGAGGREGHERGRRPDREAPQAEPAARDRGGRDSGPRENVVARASEPRASEPRASEPRASESREIELRDNEVRETQPRESGRRERGGRDRGPRDAGPRDVNVREAAARDVANREAGDGERAERPERTERPERAERPERRGGRDQRSRPRGEGRSQDRRGGERSADRGPTERGPTERPEPRYAESRRDETPIYDEPFVEVDGDDDVDDLSFGPPKGRGDKPRPVAPAWEVEAEADFEEVADEGAMPERRGRRRRGRRRGGSAAKGEAPARGDAPTRSDITENRSAARPEERESRHKRDVPKRVVDDSELDYDADVSDESIGEDVAAPTESTSSERRGSGRRRRRRGGARRPESGVGPAADLDSDELDLSEGYNLPGLLADEIESSDDEDGIHSTIPTWEDTIKILVATNIEARHRPDQKGGGNRHGGGGGHGGGGRGRGGNRNQGKR